ncbi:retinoid-inducible serine carboxypeptidase-like [Aphidius gifuensis]|uniref:retinoid-inducible serine carboxypeptidase-like n=1 Tax=Aphidius gifuensis TaxID=684658 RepID=UPI001CDD0CDC|nr:retinoid-inducible serine carboxypeptidase-like [Aphidius gifuensis]
MSVSIRIIVAIVCLLVSDETEGKQGFGPGEQDWGHVKVREHAYMFWWLYFVNPPCESSNNNYSVYDKPLLIWLQGGPGSSSSGYGNFNELGPIDLDGKPRNHTWINDYNVLFIDNPVGTGFSYTTNFLGFTESNHEIGVDLVECIRGFLDIYQKFKNTSTYITAESYGGKMAAEFALLWFKEQENKKIESNLKGIALGNPWISPIDSTLSWAPFLLQTGLIDYTDYEKINKQALEMKYAIEKGKWLIAQQKFRSTFAIIRKVTKNIDVYNFIKPRSLYENSSSNVNDEKSPQWINKMNDVKKTLNISSTWGEHQSSVIHFLMIDDLKPVTHIIEEILNNTNLDVFVYSGQFDIVVPTSGTLAWIENLKWKHDDEWKNSTRYPLVIDDIIEGYFKEFNHFKVYWVMRSGHMVPADNPSAMKQILKHLTKG